MDRLVAVDLLEGVTHGMAREDRGDLVLVIPLGDAIEAVEGQRMLVEEALPRAVVSRLDCVDGWKHTIKSPVDEGAGHTAKLASSIRRADEAFHLMASDSAVYHVEFSDQSVVE